MGKLEKKTPGGSNNFTFIFTLRVHFGLRTAHSVMPLTLAAYTAADLFSNIVACGCTIEEIFAAKLLGAMRPFFVPPYN